MSYLLEVSVCTVIFYGAYAIMFQNKKQFAFNRVYLLSSLVLSFLVPLINLPIFPHYYDVIPLASAVPPVAPGEINQHASFSVKDIFLFLYIGGVIIHLIILVVQFIRISLIIQSGQKEQSIDYVTVLTGSHIPVSSFLHYIFIPKSQVQSISKFEIRHERIHVQQKHSWDILFVKFVKAFLWFNPLIKQYHKRLSEIHEFLADQGVIDTFRHDQYEQFLAQNTATPSLALVHQFSSLFEKRIMMMNSKNQIKHWHYFLLVPLLGSVMLAFSFTTYPVTLNNDIESTINGDTFPPIPSELVGKMLDTIITLDPNTYEEIITYQLSSQWESLLPQKNQMGRDTLIQFDSETMKEIVITIDLTTGKRDTLR